MKTKGKLFMWSKSEAKTEMVRFEQGQMGAKEGESKKKNGNDQQQKFSSPIFCSFSPWFPYRLVNRPESTDLFNLRDSKETLYKFKWLCSACLSFYFHPSYVWVLHETSCLSNTIIALRAPNDSVQESQSWGYCICTCTTARHRWAWQLSRFENLSPPKNPNPTAVRGHSHIE